MSACILYTRIGKGEREEKKERRIHREKKQDVECERERDGGVLIREATVMPRPTTTTLPPPLYILTTIQKAIRHRRGSFIGKINDSPALNVGNGESREGEQV